MNRIYLLLAIIFVVTHLSASAATERNSDTLPLRQVMEYLRDGWTKIENAVPQLRHRSMQESIQNAKKIVQLNFVLSTYRYIRDKKNVDCAKYQATCGPWDPAYYNYRELDQVTLANRTFSGMTFLDCCIRHARADPIGKHRGNVCATNPHEDEVVHMDVYL